MLELPANRLIISRCNARLRVRKRFSRAEYALKLLEIITSVQVALCLNNDLDDDGRNFALISQIYRRCKYKLYFIDLLQFIISIFFLLSPKN